MNKAVVMFNIGEEPLENGINILGAHIDSPRMDVKQNPLYEDGGFAYLDTHYYGGIKKYQWVALPLALHGVVAKKDGTCVEIAIGEKETDPVFFVSDLLIHLAQEQMEKRASKVIEGEALNIMVGNRPLKFETCEKDKSKEGAGGNATRPAGDGDEECDKKNPVKEGVLKILKERYGIGEEDFVSAELEVVPAGPAREAGLDRSMILSYGQDDRVCAYTSYKAMLEVPDVSRTACCILVDKEEIGSVGATGMQSRFFENVLAEIIALFGDYSDLTLKRALAASTMLSSDVSSAYDPTYKSSFDSKNVAYLGNGMVFNKFTGARGKAGSNDANAEYLAHLRAILDEDDVNFQTAELGRVDLGDGGTIAYILGQTDVQAIDQRGQGADHMRHLHGVGVPRGDFGPGGVDDGLFSGRGGSEYFRSGRRIRLRAALDRPDACSGNLLPPQDLRPGQSHRAGGAQQLQGQFSGLQPKTHHHL